MAVTKLQYTSAIVYFLHKRLRGRKINVKVKGRQEIHATFYSAFHLIVDWVLLTLISIVPLFFQLSRQLGMWQKVVKH